MSRLAAILLFAAATAALAQAPQSPSPVQEAQSPQPAVEVIAAEASITKSDWKSAETTLNAYLRHHPADARALFDAGYVADSQDQPDAAAALYRRAIAANPKSFEAHLSLGLLLARQGKLDDARPEFVIATQLNPGDAGPELQARAWRSLAEIDRKTDPTASSNDLLQALKLTPETPADTLLAADLADQAGQFDAAAAAYRRALAADPKSPDANYGLAHVLIEQKNYADAETVLRAALVSLPDNPALTAQLATVLAAQDKAEALPLLERLYAAHPADLDIMGMLAQVRAEAGDTAGSDLLYVKLLAATPDDSQLLDAHGENLLRQLKYAEAFTVFTRSSGINPSDGDAWAGLAFAASRTGKSDVALHALTMRSEVLPETPFTYFLWATSYDALHHKDQAIAYYHHFLDAAAGKYPDEEFHAKQRLQFLQAPPH